MIAKKIGERPGYTFGEFHWLKMAFDAEAPTAVATAMFYGMKVGQPRGAGGRFIKVH